MQQMCRKQLEDFGVGANNCSNQIIKYFYNKILALFNTIYTLLTSVSSVAQQGLVKNLLKECSYKSRKLVENCFKLIFYK